MLPYIVAENTQLKTPADLRRSKFSRMSRAGERSLFYAIVMLQIALAE